MKQKLYKKMNFEWKTTEPIEDMIPADYCTIKINNAFIGGIITSYADGWAVTYRNGLLLPQGSYSGHVWVSKKEYTGGLVVDMWGAYESKHLAGLGCSFEDVKKYFEKEMEVLYGRYNSKSGKLVLK